MVYGNVLGGLRFLDWFIGFLVPISWFMSGGGFSVFKALSFISRFLVRSFVFDLSLAL